MPWHDKGWLEYVAQPINWSYENHKSKSQLRKSVARAGGQDPARETAVYPPWCHLRIPLLNSQESHRSHPFGLTPSVYSFK